MNKLLLHLLVAVILIFVTITNLCYSLRYRRGIEPFLRNNNVFFMRINMRNTMFATESFGIQYASGFRLNWFTAPVLLERSSSAKQLLHESMKTILQRYGLNGEECIKKAACELTMRNPIDAIDHIMHLLFRSGKEDEGSVCNNRTETTLQKFNCSFPLLSISTYILEQAFLIT